MGRPTTFTPEYLQKSREYLAEMKDLNARYFAIVAEVKQKTPMGAAGLAKRLGVKPIRLHAWRKANPELDKLSEELKAYRLFLTKIHES